tara:strand:+ start:749 stop:1000 length:252 start_codon:yes stop_codon:yes gene_type:complete
MFLETEKYLTQRNWVGLHEPHKTSYINKFNNTDEIYIEKIKEINKDFFMVSFPIKNSTFSYRTKFNDEKVANMYLHKIVYDYF